MQWLKRAGCCTGAVMQSWGCGGGGWGAGGRVHLLFVHIGKGGGVGESAGCLSDQSSLVGEAVQGCVQPCSLAAAAMAFLPTSQFTSCCSYGLSPN
jgi:hypothetical protein